ncbi:MAG: helix-turn-helix transcriptional regulator, partial [Burkholderiales bacterium]|nr:helix-turn-helix transcriptional regulator [Burkholderiales bacterium]
MKVDVQAAAPIVFGRFTVIPLRRELLFDGQAVELGGRAFDVLLALIEADGAVVGKEALIARVWPDRVVEENNLQVQIAALRRALADDRDLIRTIAGRGYRFAAEPRPAAPSATTTLPPTNLQQPISDLIGRESELATVTDRVFQHRLITLTGAGGIGKTRLALEVARRLQPRFTDGVWVVELGPLSDPELVSVTVATTLGLTLASGAHSAERVAAAVGTKRMLLILDNCEHVIEAATRMTEALLSANAAACVLATSREPMRSQSEHIYQVPSLGVPDAEDEAAEALMRHGAVQLFVERAKAADPHFSPVRREAMIAAICRRLDGIPLAIELAAARTAALGIDGLAARLDDRFRLLTGGHRTALPRHQTLRATLDWSHDLLPDAERVVLRRLGVFAGSFSLDAAMTVATGLSLSAADVVDAITHLVNKSLLTADIGHTVAQYRLLETMRAYAIEKLSEHGELRTFSHRHAAYFRDLFEEAEPEWERRPSTEWLALQGRQIGNVRAALDWAFGADGDTDIGITLTVAAVPLWTHLSLMDECRGRVERAMAAQNTGTIPDYHRDMRIYAALGAALLYTKGPGPEIEAAWTRTLEIAERIGARDYQLRALWGLWFDRMNNGVVRESIALAERFCRIAGDSVDQPVGDRMLGLSLHYLGDQNGAQRHLDRMLGRYVAPRQRSHIIRFQFDQRLTAHVTLAKVRWLQGFPDQAMR